MMSRWEGVGGGGGVSGGGLCPDGRSVRAKESHVPAHERDGCPGKDTGRADENNSRAHERSSRGTERTFVPGKIVFVPTEISFGPGSGAPGRMAGADVPTETPSVARFGTLGPGKTAAAGTAATPARSDPLAPPGRNCILEPRDIGRAARSCDRLALNRPRQSPSVRGEGVGEVCAGTLRSCMCRATASNAGMTFAGLHGTRVWASSVRNAGLTRRLGLRRGYGACEIRSALMECSRAGESLPRRFRSCRHSGCAKP